MPDRKRVLILFSDTGGGHRSAAEAIAEGLEAAYPRRFAVELLDVLKSYAPRPLNRLPSAYPHMLRAPQAWQLGYRLTDGQRRARALTRVAWPYVRSAAQRLAREHHADLLLSVHPLLITPLLEALSPRHPPFLTVVTDLVSTHALWYHAGVDLCLVPTETAREKALACGLRPDQVRVVGLPVGRRFCQPAGDRARLRNALGWPQDRPVVLVVGGGEGMGPLLAISREIARRGGRFALAVVAGRNRLLRRRLEARAWEVPTFVYGFERRMPEMMQAADLLVTKAGPATISEALNAGLPLVLYSRLPGQEDGNVGYVVREGVGVWAPGPRRTAEAVAAWLEDPQAREKAAAACRRIARPHAAAVVAAIVNAALSASDDPGDLRVAPPETDQADASGDVPEAEVKSWR